MRLLATAQQLEQVSPQRLVDDAVDGDDARHVEAAVDLGAVELDVEDRRCALGLQLVGRVATGVKRVRVHVRANRGVERRRVAVERGDEQGCSNSRQSPGRHVVEKPLLGLVVNLGPARAANPTPRVRNRIPANEVRWSLRAASLLASPKRWRLAGAADEVTERVRSRAAACRAAA